MPFLASALVIAFLASGCTDPVYTPKPRGYPKVNFPERGFQRLDVDYCDFTFEYPSYAQIVQDTQFFEEKPLHPCWFDIYIPAFDSRLHCSYIPVTKQKSFDELRSDAFDMANWHNKKANYIEEAMVRNDYGANGTVFEFDGPVASPYQFFLTDSTHQQFFRASLYFNTQARPDSLAPVYAFVKQDLERILETFEWK
ncbi:MAG: hypothetical protein KDC44_16890 [Phaeodactylibacter sp.]|nr:hypothetical protein [Phaeodactylibacter sp.]